MSKFFIGEVVEVINPTHVPYEDFSGTVNETGVVKDVIVNGDGNNVYQVGFYFWNGVEREEVVIGMLEKEIDHVLGIKLPPPKYKVTDLIKIINVDDPYLSVENEIKIGTIGYIEDIYKDIVDGVAQYVYSCFVRSAAILVDLYEHEFELVI